MTTRDPDAQALVDRFATELDTKHLGPTAKTMLFETYCRAVDDVLGLLNARIAAKLDEAMGFSEQPKSEAPIAKEALSIQVAIRSKTQVEGYDIPPGYPRLPAMTRPGAPPRRQPARIVPSRTKTQLKLLPEGTPFTDDVELVALGRCVSNVLRHDFALRENPGSAELGEWVYYHSCIGNLDFGNLRKGRHARGLEIRKALPHLSTHFQLKNLNLTEAQLSTAIHNVPGLTEKEKEEE